MNNSQRRLPTLLSDEGWEFEQYNFRIVDVLNSEINERSNVELTNFRVTEIENKN